MTGVPQGAMFVVKGLLSLAPNPHGPRASRFFRPRDGLRVSNVMPRGNHRQRSTLHRHRKPLITGRAA